jgi:hypothetical protein
MPIHSQRLTVSPDQSFVVFLIGARINKWWLVPIVWAVAAAMNRMMRQLVGDPQSGLLASESFPGRTTLMVQYWRSMDDLLRYAKDKERDHVPAWRKWIRQWGTRGAVGIWHETYEVQPGRYEVFYQHMPAFGLGKIGPLVPAEGPLKTAAGRLASGASSSAVAPRGSTAA